MPDMRRTLQGADVLRRLLVDANEAAAFLGLSEAKWSYLDALGKCSSPVKMDGHIHWNQQGLIDWAWAGCPARIYWTWNGGVA